MKKDFHSATLKPMKYLGIDYGTKRIGLATAESSNRIATPLKIIDNNGNALKRVVKICENKNIRTVVVGHSRDRSGQDNPVMKHARGFVGELIGNAEADLVFTDEFGSSVAARQQPGSPTHVDGSAAAVILQRYLDNRNEQN
jgi:putative Holliday junction resolvase